MDFEPELGDSYTFLLCCKRLNCPFVRLIRIRKLFYDDASDIISIPCFSEEEIEYLPGLCSTCLACLPCCVKCLLECNPEYENSCSSAICSLGGRRLKSDEEIRCNPIISSISKQLSGTIVYNVAYPTLSDWYNYILSSICKMRSLEANYRLQLIVWSVSQEGVLECPEVNVFPLLSK
jgi:hypothetical protein